MPVQIPPNSNGNWPPYWPAHTIPFRVSAEPRYQWKNRKTGRSERVSGCSFPGSCSRPTIAEMIRFPGSTCGKSNPSPYNIVQAHGNKYGFVNVSDQDFPLITQSAFYAIAPKIWYGLVPCRPAASLWIYLSGNKFVQDVNETFIVARIDGLSICR